MTPKENEFRYALIAGANKCGTTSLFRYLADHPEVCASNVKETRYFLSHSEFTPDQLREGFDSLFPSHLAACVRLEATPGYLVGGRTVAARIAAALPNVRLIFLLRSPDDRLLSYFRSQVSQPGSPCYRMETREFVERAMASATGGETGDAAFAREVRMGFFANLLLEFLGEVPAQRIQILFFEHLSADPRIVSRDVAAYLGINPDFFDNYQFTVENRSRVHRSGSFRRIAGRVNLALEPLFNRLPTLRRSARAAYNVVNATRVPEPSDLEAARGRLADYYRDANERLANLLARDWPEVEPPPWASRQ